jgi:hypothetical protein
VLVNLSTPALEGIGVIDKQLIRQRLLEVLFPRLQKVVYGSDWNSRWYREQRVCSTEYFERYFRYGVPLGDVSDLKVKDLLEIAGTASEADLTQMLSEITAANGMGQLISKLRLREDGIEPHVAARLALVLCRNGSLMRLNELEGRN